MRMHDISFPSNELITSYQFEIVMPIADRPLTLLAHWLRKVGYIISADINGL